MRGSGRIEGRKGEGREEPIRGGRGGQVPRDRGLCLSISRDRVRYRPPP